MTRRRTPRRRPRKQRRWKLNRAADIKGEDRRCIVRGDSRARDGLVRFVISPDDQVVADMDERLPGRGIWVSADRPSIEKAIAKRMFTRAARRQVRAEPELLDRIESGLADRCVAVLGMARRAGAVVTGFEKVRAAIKAGQAVCLVEASDGAADGRGKLVAAGRGLPVVETLRADELGKAFGREHAVHVAILRGRERNGAAFADRLMKQSARLAGMRGLDSSPGLENVG